MASGIYLIGRDLSVDKFFRLVEPYLSFKGLKVCTAMGIKGSLNYSGLDELVNDPILAAIKDSFWSSGHENNLSVSIHNALLAAYGNLQDKEERLNYELKNLNANRERVLASNWDLQEEKAKKEKFFTEEIEATQSSIDRANKDKPKLAITPERQLWTLFEPVVTYRDRNMALQNFNWAYEHLLPAYRSLEEEEEVRQQDSPSPEQK